MSKYTDDARRAPPDSVASHDSCRADILGSNVLTASASSPAVDDVRLVGQPPSVGCDRLPPGRESRAQGTPGRTPHPLHRRRTSTARPKSVHARSRNVTAAEDGFLRRTRYLIVDRDTKYSDEFRNALVREGIYVIRLPPRSPNLNAFAERFVRSIKSECLSRMIFFGEASLRHAIGHFMAHFPTERNHQGLANQLLRPAPIIVPSQPVHRRQRLGGMLNYYHRAAA